MERVKLDLLSLVSHELRTPLSSVLNAIRMLKEEDLSAAERTKFLDMAFRNAERLNSTLNQLLDLSKLVSGRLVCRFHEVALKGLLASQLTQLEEEAEKVGKKVSVSGEVRELPTILGDAPRLEKVIASIFENALRFSPPGSKITVKVKIRPERVGLEVSNPVEAQAAQLQADRVFQIFSQQEGVLDRAHEGVGGSLAIAREVLRQHGGGLAADLKEGKFTLTLELPVLKSERAVLKVLESRLFALRTEVGALSLLVMQVKPRAVKQVHESLRQALFRASDTVYSIADSGEVVVLMDDCKKADAPKLVRRLLKSLGTEATKFLGDARAGLASSPDDSTDPEKLLARARDSALPLADL